MVLLLLALPWALPVTARQAPVELPAQGSLARVEHRAMVRADPAGELDPAELINSDAGFRPWSPGLEEEAPPLWLKLSLVAPAESDGRYVLRVGRRFFESFDLYLPTADGGHEHFDAAHDRPADLRTLGLRYWAEFEIPPGQTRSLLLYVDIVQGNLRPLDLWVEDAAGFEDRRAATLLVFGLLLGLLVAMILQNLMLYLNLRQRGHLFYVLAMASLLLLLGVDTGLLQTYLLPEALLAQVNRIHLLATILTLLTIALFFLAFVNPQRHLPGLTRVIRIAIILLGALALASLVVPARHVLLPAIVLQPLQLAIQLILIVAAVRCGRRGATEGYIFLAAWTVFILSGFSRVFMSLDWLPRLTALEYLMYFGSVIEAAILALGLNWRVRQLYERHARAIEEQHKAARLANRDPLTDAWNRRFLKTYLEGLMATGPFDRAVLMLDLDDFKQTNDEYGHAAGDEVLRELVRRCRRVLRPGDVVCRLGGDEFVIVLSDHAGRSGVQVAERVIAEVTRRPFRFVGMDIPVTTSIGVVSSAPPGGTLGDVLRMADQALYRAKEAGRDRFAVFDPDGATPFRRAPGSHEAT